MIVVSRKGSWFGLLRSLKVWIDRTEVGGVRHNREQEFLVDAGPHEVRASMDWCRSPSLVLVLSDGEVVTLDANVPNNLTGMVGIVAFPDRLFSLVRR